MERVFVPAVVEGVVVPHAAGRDRQLPESGRGAVRLPEHARRVLGPPRGVAPWGGDAVSRRGGAVAPIGVDRDEEVRPVAGGDDGGEEVDLVAQRLELRAGQPGDGEVRLPLGGFPPPRAVVADAAEFARGLVGAPVADLEADPDRARGGRPVLGRGDGAGVAVVVPPPAPPLARGGVTFRGALLLGRGAGGAESVESGKHHHGGREYRQLQTETSSRAHSPRLQPPNRPER